MGEVVLQLRVFERRVLTYPRKRFSLNSNHPAPVVRMIAPWRSPYPLFDFAPPRGIALEKYASYNLW